MQTPAFTITLLSRSTRPLVFAALAMLVASPALAQHAHSHPAATLMQSPPAFVASIDLSAPGYCCVSFEKEVVDWCCD